VSEPGRDFIGVGVGAMVFDDAGRVFLARRGPAARNESGGWEFPGGEVAFGETMGEAVRREFREEFAMGVEVVTQLGAADHLLPDEGQHWISVSFTARHTSGPPQILEPAKCTEIGWFDLAGLPQPLTLASEQTLAAYQHR
jgi:8-oxo-dGTP diphosphatase